MPGSGGPAGTVTGFVNAPADGPNGLPIGGFFTPTNVAELGQLGPGNYLVFGKGPWSSEGALEEPLSHVRC